jgi:integrase
MPKRAKSSISEVTNRGKQYFRVSYPTPEGRRRELFATRKRAADRLKEVQHDAARYGLAAAAMSAELRADAIAAASILAGTGHTLTEAARRLLADLRVEQSGIPVADAIRAFLDSRDSRSDKYRSTLASRADYIGRAWTGRTTASITPADCQKLLDGIAGTQSPATVAHYRRQLSMIFNFSMTRGWMSANPAEKTQAVRVTSGEIDLLTPADADAILAACSRRILPAVVLGMFCGLRQAELSRLDWRAVNLAQRIVTVAASVAKTASRRVVTIPDNAAAWLAPLARESGPVATSNGETLADWHLARIAAGFGPFWSNRANVNAANRDAAEKTLRPWPANALRHSAISYRLAAGRDLPALAYESGNSPAVIQRHYNGLAAPATATAFFAILPSSPANVTRFRRDRAA